MTLAPTWYRLTSCADPLLSYDTKTDLSVYNGKVISIEEYSGCFLVSTYQSISEPPLGVTLVNCYDSCSECLSPVYTLTDCSGRYEVKYTDIASLVDYVGKTIRIPYYQNTCFTVGEILLVDLPDDTKVLSYVEFEGDYTSCAACYPQETPAPAESVNSCDPEYVSEVKCTYAELIYQKVMSTRFGVDFCCPIDEYKWSIKNMLLDHDLIADPDPDLPEPYVEYCCLTLPDPCQQVQNSCGDCAQESPIVFPEDCNCEASPNSPHDCHTYAVSVTAPQIALATGNTNTYLNGKVFFGYYKCKETKPTFEAFEEAGAEEFCVLGIPVLGYFSSDEWVDLTLTRGAVCEPEENPCCDE